MSEIKGLLGGTVRMTIQKWKDDYSAIDSYFNDDVFELMLNPEQYSEELRASYHPKKSEYQRLAPKLKTKENKEYAFEFIIDGTGATGTIVDVHSKIQDFKKLTLDKQKGNKDCYLRLRWGTLHMKCIFLSGSINYTMFSRTGLPLRAKVNARFERVEAHPVSALAQGEQVLRKVVSTGQNLIAIANDAYGNSKNFTALAKANKLNSIRNIEGGSNLILPKKSSL